MFKRLTLALVRIGRLLFYDTAVHRSARANRVYEWLFHAAFGKEATVTVGYEGARFTLPTNDITILPSLLNGSYEKREIELLRHLLRPGMTFVDVGANIGLFTVIASRLVGPGGRVFAFEPEPANEAFLRQNAAANGVTNARLENLGAGDAAARQCLKVERNSIGTHSFLDRGHAVAREIWVDVVRLDDYFADVPGPLDVVKVDVEGYEPFVLEGAKGVFDRVQFLILEYNRNELRAGYGIDELAELLADFPYRYGISGRTRTDNRLSRAELHTTRCRNILAAKRPVLLGPGRRGRGPRPALAAPPP